MEWRAGKSAGGEPGYVSEGGEFRKEKPSGASEPTDGTDRSANPFPSPALLERGESKNLKGSGSVRVVSTPAGYFVVKDAEPASARIEAVSSELAKLAGAPVPRSNVMTVGGKPSVVQEYVGGKTVRELEKADTEAAKLALQSVPKDDVSKTVLFDYLLGNTDAHNGNYLVTDSGRMVAIDKEMVLGRGNLRGQRFEPPHFLSLTRSDGLGMRHQFDPRTLRGMAEGGAKMADSLDSRGMRAEARQVRDRATVLSELAKRSGENPATAADLYSLAASGVTPPNLSVFGRVAWHLTKG